MATIATQPHDLNRLVRETWDAVLAENAKDPKHPKFYVRGFDELVQIIEGQIVSLGKDQLSLGLSDFIRYEHTTGQNQTIVQDFPPDEMLKALLHGTANRYPGAPHIAQIVDVPTVSKNGQLILEEGYHPADELYYSPAPGLQDIEIGPVTMASEIEDAKSFLLDDYLGDFEFKNQASRANALGMMLLPFMTTFINDQTPLHVLHARQAGTGKTTLAEACMVPGCGWEWGKLTPTDQEDEMRKKLTAMLMEGKRNICIDNQSKKLDSSTLAAALTARVWTDRVLGVSQTVTIPIRNIWMLTGNNVELSSEQARRSQGIFMQVPPGKLNPAQRPVSDYRYPELVEWGISHRKELVIACLILIKHWLQGAYHFLPTEQGDFLRVEDLEGEHYKILGQENLGSFNPWARTIGGILRAAEISGFLTNKDEILQEMEQDVQDDISFLKAIHELNQPLSASEIASKAGFGGELNDALPLNLQGARNLDHRIGVWLRERKGSDFGGYTVHKITGRPTRWQVTKES